VIHIGIHGIDLTGQDIGIVGGVGTIHIILVIITDIILGTGIHTVGGTGVRITLLIRLEKINVTGIDVVEI